MKTFRIIEFDSLDSTNKYMKENLDRLSVFDIVVADRQTAGYGRMQRRWFDNTENLSFSLYLEFPVSERNGLLTQIAALSVTDVLSELLSNVSIKWPNDCLVNGKKIAGILIENIVIGNKTKMIVGIGLNVNNKVFDSELQSKATSLFLETGIEHDKIAVLNSVLSKFEIYLDAFVKGDYSFMNTVRKKSYVIGKKVQLFEGNVVLVKTIDDYGRLEVLDQGELKTYMGSEISLTNIY